MTNQSEQRPYFCTPAISPDGSLIAFGYTADIWLVDSAGGAASRMTGFRARHEAPRWSPDGRTIAFSSNRVGNGEIYLLAVDGGETERLTFHDSLSTPEAWSPDGAFLYFSSTRDLQGSAFYRVARTGGTPVSWLNQPYEHLEHLAVSADGGKMAFNITRNSWWRRGPTMFGSGELWVASNMFDADDFRRISSEYSGRNRWPMWTPDGQALYIVSDRSGTENIWRLDLEDGSAEQRTHFGAGRVLWPTLSADGRTMVFEREFGIWRLDLASGEAAPVPIRARADITMSAASTALVSREVAELALSPDNKKLAFVAQGDIFVDFADKETDKERRQGPSFAVTSTPFREDDVAWSPDSRALVYTADRTGDPQVYRYDFGARAEQQLTTSQGVKHTPRYSPDGKWLAYGVGRQEIRLIELASGDDRPWISAAFWAGMSFAWSPDSRWVVFCARDSQMFTNLYVQQRDEQTPRQITFLSNISAYLPRWSPDGQFILFSTAQYRRESQIARVDLKPRQPQFREDDFEKLFEQDRKQQVEPVPADAPEDLPDDSPASVEVPAPADMLDAPVAEAAPERAAPPAALETKAVEIVFNGIARRLRILSEPELNAMPLAISPDSRDLIFLALVLGKRNLWTMPLDDARADSPPRQLTTTTGSKWAAQFTQEGKAFFYIDSGQIYTRKFPTGEPTLLPVAAEVTRDFAHERSQVFDEAWRVLRDNFYDPTFRGQDWAAVRDRFRPYVAGVQTRSELRALLQLMVGELRASHLWVSSPGGRNRNGYLGVLFDQAALAERGVHVITTVIPDGPAALADVVSGETLHAINGVRLEPGSSIDALLAGCVGRRVRLGLTAQDGAQREVAVRPVGVSEYRWLRYRTWVYANEAYVHQASAGRLGYVHIYDMDYASYRRFMADLDAETYRKEGVVIDVRFNPGGHIGSFILDVLARRTALTHAFRDQPPANSALMNGNRVLNKPTVMVINERSSSNAEMFAEDYRRLGLGKVVGRPTAGAVIGTVPHTLLDGTSIGVPRYRILTLDGEDLEGTGRAVDQDVALPLGAAARGRDPQLDAAVALLLSEIDTAGRAALITRQDDKMTR
ncbi:MAG: PD40 domain-containing protein [Roseiflexaceae bacterium]|nr:PD40 domain-containing protein [Roseiflexaceae bacterium]